jgi:hypothetical protein
MPTAAKLVCAVLLAAVAWATGEMIQRHVAEEGVSVGLLREALALGGLIVGWKHVGSIAGGKAERGTTLAVGLTAGIGGGVILAVLALFLNAARFVITEALDITYTEVGDAMSAWIETVYTDAFRLMEPPVVATFFGGATLVGLIGWAVGRAGGRVAQPRFR